jgi:hypothetical protein
MSYIHVSEGVCMSLLNQSEFKQKIVEKLALKGVKAPFAEGVAAVFLEEVLQGHVLSFRDLGSVKLEGQQIAILPLEVQPSSDATKAFRWHSTQDVDHLAEFHTVEEESSIRYLQQGGYPRKYAESILHAAKR